MQSIFGELARKEIRNLPLYVPGKPIDEVKRELGLTEIIKLASNENPFPAALRITFGTHEENEKFIHALEEIMGN